MVREPIVKPTWLVSLYPDAAEAGGTLRTLAGSSSVGVGVGDPERAKVEAGRRARTKVRCYCAANRLNRLGTLTYGPPGCYDPAQVRHDAGEFFRALRDGLGGTPLPYLWVPEWHPGGHGLHLHFAVARYIPRRVIDSAWGRGFVHIKLLGDLPTGASHLDEARLAARYLGKYVSKDPAQGWEGLHRYEVAQGFQPRRQAFTAATGQQALRQMSEQMNRAPEYVWWSSETDEWHGPPAVWASWAA